ncbi:MAG: aromatic ring-hydroxylating dioxygenase subunit alpha [Bdellovibrionales bacterium]|nr:aromatic ring-hydroxylating dioxygenase subunit alpha [Bdellovibrionales bacterium]
MQLTTTWSPDIQRSRTLPPETYTTEALHKSEQLKIFSKFWQFVGTSSGLEAPGAYRVVTVASTSVVLIRQQNGQIKALINICRHRSGPLAAGQGQTKILQCKYHGWTYDLEGKLKGSPEFAPNENFDKASCRLPEVKIAEWGSFLFAAIDPVVSFEEWYEPVLKLFPSSSVEGYSVFHNQSYPVKANWKIYVDNYLEGYHIPIVHPELFQELDYSKYTTEVFKWCSRQHSPARAVGTLYNQGTDREAAYYWVYPNLMLNIYQGFIQFNTVVPNGVGGAEVVFDWSSKQDSETERNRFVPFKAFSDLVQEQDREICEDVQKNLNSGHAVSGPYSEKRETGVHHFHGLWWASLRS